LPGGISLSATTGASINVSGTPTAAAAGTYAYSIKVTDSTTPTAQTAGQNYNGTIIPAVTTLTVNCTPTTGPTQVGVAYSATCTAAGGTIPYSWLISPGALPAGLSLSGANGSTVTISGTPTTSGPYVYTLSLTDSGTPTPQSKTQPFSGSIAGPITLNCSPSTGPAKIGVAYSATCTVSGGTAPYTWSISSGTLPTGVTLSANTGATITVSGSPTAAGPYNYTVKATDSATPTAQTAAQSYSGNIPPPFTLSCTPTAGPIQVGVSYSATCTVSGGTAPYNWSIGSGALPAGLSLSATTGSSISITGTVTSTSAYNYTIKVTDNTTPAAQTASQSYSSNGPLTVSALTLTCTPVAGPAQVGVAYSATCAASGGIAPYIWSVGSGTLPAGLSFSATTGTNIVVSGTPTASGTYSYTIKITDSTTPSTQTASQSYSGNLPAPAMLTLNCSPGNGPAVFGAAYSATCTASNGVAPYGWSISSGSLPAGLSLSATTGNSVAISGVPTVSGPYSYTVKLTDSSAPAPQSATQPYSGTVPVPALSVVPSSLTFNFQPGGSVPAQQASVSTTPPGVAYTVTVGSGCAWLTAGPLGGTAPGTVTVSADPTGLSPATYDCTITIAGGGGSQNVFVSFTVSGPTLQLNPASLNFTYLTGDQAPAAQNVSVSSSNANVGASFTVSSGCSWVTVNPTGGITPATLSISANPAGLAQTTYTCSITVTSASTSNSPRLIVKLAVSSAPSVFPSTVLFTAKQGSTTPVVQTISLNGPDTPTAFTAAASTSSGGDWLTAGTSSGSTPANIVLQANPSGLSSATYSGTFAITFAGSQPVNVNAQLTVSPVTVTVTPNRLQFHFPQGSTLPSPQTLSVITSDGSQPTFTYTSTGPIAVARVSGTNNLMISVNSSLSQGVTNASITVNATVPIVAAQNVPVTINVDPPSVVAPVLSVAQTGLTFSFVQGSSAGSQVLSLANLGGGTLNVKALASTSSGGEWLTVSCPQTAVTNSAAVACTVSADPSKVIPNAAGGVAGTYSGEVALAGDVAGQSGRIPVTMTLSALPNMLLSRSGFSFSVVQGGTNPPADTLDILSGGVGALTWTAQADTLGGGNWLKISSVSGTATAADPASLTVSVDATALTPGTLPGPLYGSVVINATDPGTGRPAANSPKTVAVVLNVLGSGSYLTPIVRPGGLIFSGDAGAANVPAQSVAVFNLGKTPISYSSAAVTDDGGNWCTSSPPTGTVSQNGAISIELDYTKLKVGIQDCVLRLLFADGSLQTVTITAVVTVPGGGLAFQSIGPISDAVTPVAGNCNPTNLGWTVSLTSPAQGASVFAFQATDLEAKVLDGCQAPVDGANVSVTFSNADHYQKLVSSGKGRGMYRGSWTPRNVPDNVAQSAVLLQVVATPEIGQSYKQGGSTPNVPVTVVQQVKNPTLITDIVNSASYTPHAQVAPCSWVAIFGQNLADSQVTATQVPLGNSLGGATALMGGSTLPENKALPLPLNYVDNGQINAQIPCGLQSNTQLDLQVVNGDVQSPIEQVVVADSQPALFTINEQGFGQGAIFWTTPTGNHVPADANNPVSSGSLVEIYCTGLGPVVPLVTEGTVSPDPAATTTQLPNVTIGGLTANRITFAGLTPGVVGLYQINAEVPANVPIGSAVPVVVTLGNQASQTGVTIAVH
jgi:uncharacterized protein (TIGR03437 family)